MKKLGCIAKVLAVLAAIAGTAYLISRYWDTIVDAFYAVVGKIKEKKEACAALFPSEYDDYDDTELEL